jgi:hypothetical protein
VRRIAGAAAALGALTCLALFAGQVRASVVRSLSLEELTKRADEIVVGIPTEQQSRRHIDGKLIVTDFSLQTETVLKGESKAGETTVITVLGGKLDGIGLQVPGEAGMAIGQRVIAFLYRAPRSGDLRVVGMSQGVMPIQPQPNGTSLVMPSSGAALVDPGTGDMKETSGALAQPEPLPVFLQRISKIVTGVK